MKRKAVFLDRDGTINVEKNYLYKIEDFQFIEGVPEAIALLNKNGYLVIVVSNQAGVARGYYTEKDVQSLHEYINCELEKKGAHIDAFYYCPHHPVAGIGCYKKKCHCRKPETGMFEQACLEFPIDRKDSWMIGDNCSDIEAGKKFQLKTMLVRTGYGEELEKKGYKDFDEIANDLLDAIRKIIFQEENKNG